MVEGGEGLGRHEGIAIFVPRSAPGDRLRVRISERKPGYGRAEILEILEPGPGRREPPCPHFDRCGGCDLQHLDEETQLRRKSEAVVETLRRLGGVTVPPRFQVISGDPWGYRLRTQLHLETTERGLQVGYFARGSHDLVAIDVCPVLVPELEKPLAGLPRRLRDETHKRLDLAAGDGTWTCSPPVPALPQGEVSIRVDDLVYEYDARCFFQAHRGLTEQLVAEAMGDELAPAMLGSDNPAERPLGEHAFDLFSGVGLFSLALAQRYQKVTAVEGDRIAVRFAKRNWKRNRTRPGKAALAATDFHARSVESWINDLPDHPDRVLVDPPRSGLSAAIRRRLMEKQPRWLTYVSCQSATLARDLKILLRAFSLESLTLIDMFPQTGHMEIVAHLKPKGMTPGESESSEA